MKIVEGFKESMRNALGWNEARAEVDALAEEVNDGEKLNHMLVETLSRLQLEMENQGYDRMGISEDDFSRPALTAILRHTLVMAIKNPITMRTVWINGDYVFGRGVRVVSKNPLVQSVIDEHWNYEANQKVLYAHESLCRQERSLQISGNLTFILFTNPRTGRVIIKDVVMREIEDIIRDPEDVTCNWFLKRISTTEKGIRTVHYHPFVGVNENDPRVGLNPQEERGEIHWDAPCLTYGPNKYNRMKFALPEVYAQNAWATAYKEGMEDFSSIMRAFARMSYKFSGFKGKKQVAAAKSKLNTAATLNQPIESNKSTVGGSIGLFGKDIDAQPIKTAGATTNAREFKPLLDMAAAGGGHPSSFYGDATASKASAETLDRPTELKMKSRQRLWMTICEDIFSYCVIASAKAPFGILREAGATLAAKVDPFTDLTVEELEMPNNTDPRLGVVGEPIPMAIRTVFPDLLERNVTDRIRALVNAVTFFGKQLTDIIPDKRLVALWLMDAMNIENPEQYIPEFIIMWEKNLKSKDGKPVDAVIVPPPPPVTAMGGNGAEDPSQGGATGKNG